MSDEITPIRIEQRRLFDWRLVISLIAAGALLFGAFAAVKAFEIADAKDHNAAVAAAEIARGQAQVHELIEQLRSRDEEIKAQVAAEEANTARSAANQAVMLANQAAMLRFQAEELAWTRRILNFSRAHPGQPIPASFLVAPRPPTLRKISSPTRHHQSRSMSRHGKKK